MAKKKGPGRPKSEETIVVGFRISKKKYNWLTKNKGKPEILAKEFLEKECPIK